MDVGLLQKLCPNTSEDTLQPWADAMDDCWTQWGITSGISKAMFLAQTSVETWYYTRISENLNYSQESLLRVFPTHFSGPNDAANYAHQPEKIANRVYANRYGNGSESSGDGWRYRGQGGLQITFRDNHADFAAAAGISLADEPAYISTVSGSLAAAGWFWKSRNLDRWATTGNVEECTRVIQGSLGGLDDRKTMFIRARSLLGV